MDSPTQNFGDNEAAQNSYEEAISSDHASVRAALRTDRPAADVGLVLAIVGIAVLGFVWSVAYGLILAAGFTAWFLVALAVIRIGGGRGKNAFMRAYIATFGWGNWF